MIEDLVPIPDDVTQEWWDATRECRLLLQKCDDCGNVQHYPRVICLACSSLDLSWISSGGTGVVDSFTVVHRAPHPDLTTPYVIARIKLDEGPTLLSRIVDSDEASISCDARVRLDWLAVSDDFQLPVFRMSHQ